MMGSPAKGVLLHPLSGSDPLTLCSLIRANRPIPWRGWGRLALALSASAARTPFSVLERGLVPVLRQRVGTTDPPVFIVGHWRSGTTHLYNLMTRSDRFGYVPPLATGLPWDMLLLARLLRPWLARLLPRQRFVDPIPVHLDSPQEDEAAMANMQPVSFYHGLYFPRTLHEHFRAGVFFEGCSDADVARWQRRFRHFLDKLHVLHGGRRLLIKNPVYSVRIAMLRQMLPGAKFIHVHRDPLAVFASMRHFYVRLLEVFAIQPYDPAMIDDLILESYPPLMQALIEQAEQLPAHDFVEIGYDELDQSPLEALRRIYDGLELEGFEADRPAFERHLASTRNYRGNRHALPPELRERVEHAWAPFIERWGAAQPA